MAGLCVTQTIPPKPAVGQAILIRVFVDPMAGVQGGNPMSLVLDARNMSTADMRTLAAHHGYESSFVLPPDDPEQHDLRLRYFVPAHEMEMCGHATVGTLWALRQWELWTKPSARIQTLSGDVEVIWDDTNDRVWISQPDVRVEALTDDQRAVIACVLRIDPAMPGLHAINACTSRVKTLVRLPDIGMLNALKPNFGAMGSLCEAIGSTGLYPYVLHEDEAFARQFPKSSGYLEDAATGIAAAALWGYLNVNGMISAGSFTVRQGVAMGAPSAIHLHARDDAPGCWLSGEVAWQEIYSANG